MLQMIMANDWQPVISYSCVILTTASSVFVMEIMMTIMMIIIQGQGHSGYFQW